MKTVETMTDKELYDYINRPSFHQISASSVVTDKHGTGTYYRVSIARIGYFNQADAWYEVRVDSAIGPSNSQGPGGAAVQFRSMGEMYPFAIDKLQEAIAQFKELIEKYKDPIANFHNS